HRRLGRPAHRLDLRPVHGRPGAEGSGARDPGRREGTDDRLDPRRQPGRLLPPLPAHARARGRARGRARRARGLGRHDRRGRLAAREGARGSRAARGRGRRRRGDRPADARAARRGDDPALGRENGPARPRRPVDASRLGGGGDRRRGRLRGLLVAEGADQARDRARRDDSLQRADGGLPPARRGQDRRCGAAGRRVGAGRRTAVSILGNRVARVEDRRFLTGNGTYIENLALEGAHAVTFVRSPLAHARVLEVDATAAEAVPGVQVVTGADVDISIGPPPIPVLEQGMRRPVVARDIVRFVGEIVAVVVSPDRASGADAAELVDVEYDPLPVVVSPVEAAKDEVLLFPELGTNVAGRAGSADHDDDLFADCEVVVRQTLVSQRMAACPLEVRSAAAEVAPDGRITAWLATQVPQRDHHGLCATLGLEPEELRVVAPDIGGAFGAKAGFGSEELLVVWLARRLGKPVRWTETRSESMVNLPHGRGQQLEAALGGTRDGELLAYRLDILQDAGAYPTIGAFLPN